MRLSALLITFLLLFSSCERGPQIPFIDVLMFQIDFESLEPEGATVFSFPEPRLDSRHPFPINLEEIPATSTEPSVVKLIYTPENVTVFEATVSDAEIGEVSIPSFTPKDDLRVNPWRADFHKSFSLHSLPGSSTNLSYVEFWEKIKNFELTDRITHANMKGLLYLYEPNKADTTSWKWILMLAH